MKNYNSHLDEELIEKLSLYIADNLDELKSISTAKRQEAIIDILMRAERSVYLDEHESDKGNGFYQREMGSCVGRLSLNVPRVRKGDFRPQILPDPYKRDTIERTEVIDALLSASYTPKGISSVLKKLGMHYSEEELKKLEMELIKEFEALCNRELNCDAVSICIDAYKAEIMDSGSIKTLTIFTVLGINFNGKKDLFGIYFNIGNETKEFWLRVLNDLVKRGLKRLIIVISDDFSGLKDAVNALFPTALHQLCLVHLQRNVQRNTSKEDAKQINHSIKKLLSNGYDYHDALNEFEKVIAGYRDKYPSFAGRIIENSEHYIACFKFHPEVRKYFYTTNAVESFNSILESIRSKTGGFFQSQDVIKSNIYINYLRLKKKWHKGNARLITNIYYLKQLFAELYGEAPAV